MDSKSVKRFKTTFSRDWLENENYKSWIKEIPDDNSVYFCVVCNKIFSCSSRVSKHAASETHRTNMLKDNVEETKETEKATEARKREFYHSWLENKKFKPWLKKIPNDPYNCFCSFCNSTFRCGLDALKRHSDTKKHIFECQKRHSTVNLDTSDEDSRPAFEDRKKIAEIKFAALIAEKNIAFQTAESILSFFQDLGKDPGILQSITMNRKKGPEIINKVLYVREQERIVETLQNNKFSIFIDETSDITNDRWMTLLVRYVDPQTLNVRTELLELIHLGADDCSAEELFTTFKDEMCKKQIPLKNILALSCDNASITTKKYEIFKTKLQECCENLITMPCPCHATTLIADAACAAIPETCEKLLRKLASFISCSPKRACIFYQLQRSFNYNDKNIRYVKQSDMRWLSRHSCVARLNEDWDKLLKFLKEDQSSEKSKSKFGTAILSMMQNPETQAYFLFLEYVLDSFNKFNASFQAQETKIYLLPSAAKSLLKIVLRNVIKTPLLNFAVNGMINPLLECNRRSPDQIIVGPACQEFLDRLNEEGQNEIVKSVYTNCLSFYNIAVTEIRERLLIKEEFLNKLRIFEPRLALHQKDEKNKPNKSFQDVLFVAKRFGKFNRKVLRKEWQALDLNFALEQKKKIIHSGFDDAWKTITATKGVNGKFKYPTLTKLINAIRSLPNSNADSEKMFSVLTDVKTKKRNKLCPIHVQALCVFKSSLRATGQTARTMTIDARHLALMSSENLYQTNVKKDKKDCLLGSSCVAIEYPSTSSDL